MNSDSDKNDTPRKPAYKYLGESGLVEDEEGNIFSASELADDEAASEPSAGTPLLENSFVTELDDKANPAYWYYYYDPRYCGPSREAYMEKMARRHGYPYRQHGGQATAPAPASVCCVGNATNRTQAPATVAEPEPAPESAPETAHERAERQQREADRQQREAEREGLRPDTRSYNNAVRSWRMVNRRGEVIIPFDTYSHIGHFHNGRARVMDKKTGLFGFVDIHGKEVIPCTWRAAGEFSEYMAGVQDEHKRCGFIDVSGRQAVACVWEETWPFHGGLAKVQDHHKIGMIDTNGKRVVPCIWRGMGDFSEGLAGVQDEQGRCGYIDRTGQVVIPCQWKNVWTFSEGMAVVQDFNKRLGFIDKSGRLVIPCRWKKAEFFKDGRARVTEGGGLFRKEKWVYIDRQGRVISKEVKK